MTATLTDTDQVSNEWGLQFLVTRRDARSHPPGSAIFEATLRQVAMAVARRNAAIGERSQVQHVTVEPSADRRAVVFTYRACFGDDHHWDNLEWAAVEAAAFLDKDVPDRLIRQLATTGDPAVVAEVDGYRARYAEWEAATLPALIDEFRPALTTAFTSVFTI